MRKTENHQYVETISSTLDDDFSHKYKWTTQVNNDKLYHYIIINDTASKRNIINQIQNYLHIYKIHFYINKKILFFFPFISSGN